MRTYKLHNQIIASLLMLLQALMMVMAIVSLESIPGWTKQIGHLHPILLHLPIAFILLLLPASMILKNDESDENHLFILFLHYNALAATITALLGLLAAAANEYDQELLFNHKWLSIATALLSHLLIYLFHWSKYRRSLWISAVVITSLIMMIGSHFGGSLTHGEGYLNFSNTKKVSTAFKPLTDSTKIYNDVVQTVLINKCLECHNDKKSKGGLNLNNYAAFLKGGKTGAAFVSGDLEKSLFIQRILLDLDDKKHMPPKGKSQLTSDEIFLFKEWVVRNADTTTKFHQLDLKDTLRSIIEKIVQSSLSSKPSKSYTFEKASEDKIASLNSPFRRVMPLDIHSPALIIKFYLKEKFSPKLIEECKSISKQVVEINLSTMPADDKVLEMLSGFENLEKLNLNGTAITGAAFKQLQANKKLEEIQLANTQVNYEAALLLANIASLKSVYLWNSKVSDREIKNLQSKFPKIKWDIGYIPDENELLKLTPPSPTNTEKMILDPGENITLKHPLPGAQIRYTIDGSKPDSITGILYTKPFSISGLTQINAVGTSIGWLTSNVSSFTYFLKGHKIDSATIINPPAEKYRANGEKALIDLNKGTPNNLNLNWIGFREQTMKAGFHLSEGKIISKVILSLADNTGSYVFPPEKIIVKGGIDKQHLKTLGSLIPVQPKAQRNSSILPVTVDFMPGAYKYLEIEAINVQKLPKWHPGKKEKGWVFVDEVFFY
ncbi:MAG: hypothetical protein RI965_2081 [Bacteroidota bacterium]